jgi:transcriptional regulator with XRE-family HTH domain
MDTTIVKKETGKRLKKLRERLGHTQEQFAELLDISVTLYKKMESGSYNISVKNLRRLKELTGISIDYIMFGEQEEFEEIWMSLENSDNLTKMKMLLRLVAYFGVDSRECFSERKKEEEYIAFLEEWMKRGGENINKQK